MLIPILLWIVFFITWVYMYNFSKSRYDDNMWFSGILLLVMLAMNFIQN